jgi:hypothetical protein
VSKLYRVAQGYKTLINVGRVEEARLIWVLLGRGASEPGVKQALDNREDQRSRDAEHQQTGGRFAWPQQLPAWRQYDSAGTHRSVATAEQYNAAPKSATPPHRSNTNAHSATSRICPASANNVVPVRNIKFTESRVPSRPRCRSRAHFHDDGVDHETMNDHRTQRRRESNEQGTQYPHALRMYHLTRGLRIMLA